MTSSSPLRVTLAVAFKNLHYALGRGLASYEYVQSGTGSDTPIAFLHQKWVFLN